MSVEYEVVRTDIGKDVRVVTAPQSQPDKNALEFSEEVTGNFPKVFVHNEQIQITNGRKIDAFKIMPTRMMIARHETKDISALLVLYEHSVPYEPPF